MNHIATFAAAKEEPMYYEFWVYLRIMTPDVILKLNSDDFVTLFHLMKDQSRKFHTNHRVKREYAPSNRHPYNKWPNPVYEKRDGKFILVSGKEGHREKVNLSIGTLCYNQLNNSDYQTNRNVKLDMNNILHLKDRYVTNYNNGIDFHSFENDFVKACNKQPSNVNVSMNMLDENQFSLKETPKDPRLAQKDPRLFKSKVNNTEFGSKTNIQNTDFGYTNILEKMELSV